MTKSIIGSETEKNLLTSFAGESQARNRYTFAASQAKKEGKIKIQQIFEETANQEKEHGKRFFKFLGGGEVTITAAFPAGLPKTLEDHLALAAAGERHEWSEMYPACAKTAEKEGFAEIADVFHHVATAEHYHEHRFQEYLDELRNGTYFKSPTPTVWRCLNCGYIHEGLEPPEVCPACAHPRDYFEALFNVVKA